MVLESLCHGDNCMVTLTYENDPWTLVPRDLTLFMKRLRKLAPGPVRFFACGEYGEISFRPHFHIALFGLGMIHRPLIEQAWSVDGKPIGFVHVGDLNEKSAAYVAGYVCKKLTKKFQPELQGRHPEFCRMSNRPHGIGAVAIDSIMSSLVSRGGSMGVARAGDVPSEVRIAGKKYPLGRYLKSRLRCAIGWDTKVPKEVVRALSLEKSLESIEDMELLARKRKASDQRAKSKVVLRRSFTKGQI